MFGVREDWFYSSGWFYLVLYCGGFGIYGSGWCGIGVVWVGGYVV